MDKTKAEGVKRVKMAFDSLGQTNQKLAQNRYNEDIDGPDLLEDLSLEVGMMKRSQDREIELPRNSLDMAVESILLLQESSSYLVLVYRIGENQKE